MDLFNAKAEYNKNAISKGLKPLSGGELKTYQKFLTECLGDILYYCEKNNITCILCGGSCLGAVRHNGFIPWDDDVDLCMSRSDYEKFVATFEAELGDKYILNAPNTATKSLSRFPKVLVKNTVFTSGDSLYDDLEKIFFDIFILENIPANSILKVVKGCYVNFLEFISGQVLIYQTNKKNKDAGILSSKLRLIIGFMFSWREYSRWNYKIDKAIQYKKYTGIVGLPTGRKHYFGEVFNVNVFYPPQESKFENLIVKIPNISEEYLSNLYGSDYLELPPLEKREHHYVREVKF